MFRLPQREFYRPQRGARRPPSPSPPCANHPSAVEVVVYLCGAHILFIYLFIFWVRVRCAFYVCMCFCRARARAKLYSRSITLGRSDRNVCVGCVCVYVCKLVRRVFRTPAHAHVPGFYSIKPDIPICFFVCLLLSVWLPPVQVCVRSQSRLREAWVPFETTEHALAYVRRTLSLSISLVLAISTPSTAAKTGVVFRSSRQVRRTRDHGHGRGSPE